VLKLKLILLSNLQSTGRGSEENIQRNKSQEIKSRKEIKERIYLGEGSGGSNEEVNERITVKELNEDHKNVCQGRQSRHRRILTQGGSEPAHPDAGISRLWSSG
jgi:hypothetical protein